MPADATITPVTFQATNPPLRPCAHPPQQLRCCNSAEQAEVQAKVGQLAAHPSLRCLQVQLSSNLMRRPADWDPGFVEALQAVALGTGASVSIQGVK